MSGSQKPESSTTSVSSRLNLGLYFAITSLVVLCVQGAFLWRYHVRTATDVILEMTRLQNEHIMQSVEAAIRRSMSQVLKNKGEDAKIDVAFIDQLVIEKTAGFPVKKVKIYDTAGSTFYSTDPRELGKLWLR